MTRNNNDKFIAVVRIFLNILVYTLIAFHVFSKLSMCFKHKIGRSITYVSRDPPRKTYISTYIQRSPSDGSCRN